MASLVLLPILTISAPPSGAADTTHDVVIVGAGSAGLYATKTLVAEGYSVLVLEATDRHGGRMYSKTLGTTRIEMGAEEHYLRNGHNPVYPAVIAEFGRDVYVDAYVGTEYMSMDGSTNNCWDDEPLCYDDPDMTDHWAYWTHVDKRNWHLDYSVTAADDVLADYGVGVGHRAYHLYDKSYAGGIWSTSLDRLGAASLAEQNIHWKFSNSIRVLGPKDLGYLDAINTIWWDDIIDNVMLNRPVVSVDSSGDFAVVTDATGARHSAHHVIVTVSIGVLQAETIDFIPDLPATTVDAYNNIGMGTGMKVAMRFDNSFWNMPPHQLSWLVNEGLASACWAPTHYKVDSTDNILMCYPMGNDGLQLSAIGADAGGGAAGDAAIIEAVLADLDSTYNGVASPNYIDGIVQDWIADPYVRGAYSFPTLGTYENVPSARSLLQVSINDVIFFAGEGTNNNNSATVPGAMQTGERAAEAIDDILNGVSNPPPLPPEPCHPTPHC